MPIIGVNSYPNSTALTITLASLASTVADPPVGRESAEVLQSTDLGLDVLIDGKITTGTSPTAAKAIRIWAWAGAFDGTNVRRPAGATGGDAGLTPGSWWAGEFKLLHYIDTSNTSNVTYTFAGKSLLACFGGTILPARWGLFIDHNTGVALNATGGNHELRYTPAKLLST
jgi:hypothetical protein